MFKWTPNQHLKKKCKEVQHFSNKWLKTTHFQLSQKRFKTCLRKLTIIAPFIHRNNLYFIFFKYKNKKKKTKKREKESDKFLLLLNFSKLPQKRCQGGCRLHCQRPQVYEEDEAEEATKNRSPIKYKQIVHWSRFCSIHNHHSHYYAPLLGHQAVWGSELIH